MKPRRVGDKERHGGERERKQVSVWVGWGGVRDGGKRETEMELSSRPFTAIISP